MELKNKYDPTNFFHLSQNIVPTAHERQTAGLHRRATPMATK
jgi:hypothetical protein